MAGQAQGRGPAATGPCGSAYASRAAAKSECRGLGQGSQNLQRRCGFRTRLHQPPEHSAALQGPRGFGHDILLAFETNPQTQLGHNGAEAQTHEGQPHHWPDSLALASLLAALIQTIRTAMSVRAPMRTASGAAKARRATAGLWAHSVMVAAAKSTGDAAGGLGNVL